MAGSLRFFLISIVVLILSLNIYLNLDKICNFIPKDFSKDIFKLYYFKVNGRAAIIRALFSCSKVKFENNYIDKNNWQEQKKIQLYLNLGKYLY